MPTVKLRIKRVEKVQLSMDFERKEEKEDIIKDKIKQVDPLNTTPMEALNILFELKKNLK